MQTVSRARGTLSRHPEIVVVVALAVPLLVALAVVHGTHWYPTGDYAQTELNVRAIPSHPPLIGVGMCGPDAGPAATRNTVRAGSEAVG